MPKVAPIDQRKADHIKINLEQDVRSALTTGLENYHFTHEALPELDLNRIDTSLKLFDKQLAAPIGFLLAALALLLSASVTGPARSDRNWYPYLAQASHVDIQDTRFAVAPVSDWSYERSGPISQTYIRAEYHVADLRNVWFMLEPQPGMSVAAHTLLLFEFSGDRMIGLTIEALGASAAGPHLVPILRRVQNELFNLGCELATPDPEQRAKLPRIEPRHVDGLERDIDAVNDELPALKSFVLPGGGWSSAYCHLARTVCRRAERLVVALAAHEDVGEHSVQYLKRLSLLAMRIFYW